MVTDLKQGDAILVTTSHRGVFFGYFDSWVDDEYKHIRVTKCRNCISWSSLIKGVFGLAATGPDGNCRVGPAVDVPMLRDVTAVVRVTDEAIKCWEAAPWS